MHGKVQLSHLLARRRRVRSFGNSVATTGFEMASRRCEKLPACLEVGATNSATAGYRASLRPFRASPATWPTRLPGSIGQVVDASEQVFCSPKVTDVSGRPGAGTTERRSLFLKGLHGHSSSPANVRCPTRLAASQSIHRPACCTQSPPQPLARGEKRF